MADLTNKEIKDMALKSAFELAKHVADGGYDKMSPGAVLKELYETICDLKKDSQKEG